MTKLMKQTAHDQAALGAILKAIEVKDMSKLEDAIARGSNALQSDVPNRGSGALPLQAAIRKGDKGMVEMLIDGGAPLEAVDGSGMTPLEVSADF